MSLWLEGTGLKGELVLLRGVFGECLIFVGFLKWGFRKQGYTEDLFMKRSLNQYNYLSIYTEETFSLLVAALVKIDVNNWRSGFTQTGFTQLQAD